MKYLLFCSCIAFGMRIADDIQDHSEHVQHNHDRKNIRDLPANPAIVLGRVMRDWCKDRIYVRNIHAPCIAQHWDGWGESLVIALFLTGLLAFVSFSFTSLFKLMGLFNTVSCDDVIHETVMYMINVPNMSYSTNNGTHFIYIRRI